MNAAGVAHADRTETGRARRNVLGAHTGLKPGKTGLEGGSGGVWWGVFECVT